MNLYIIFPNSTPPTVPKENAINPRIMIFIVTKFKKCSPSAVAPTVIPSTIVIQYSIAPLACSTKFETTPASFIRFPSISIPISGADDGTKRITMIVTAIGKIIFSLWLTNLSCFISTILSFLLVNNFIIGG